MTWTTTAPTTPGWYWMRLPWNAIDGRDDKCVSVQHDRDGVLRASYSSNQKSLRPTNLPAGTQWAGPIPRPAEA